MNQDLISDLPLFLAHSLELERESAERLREFADTMRHHQQHALAQLFAELAGYSDLHAQEIAAICEGHKLPRLKAWEFTWPGEEPPMIDQENAAADFYAAVAAQSSDAEIVKHAAAFAQEEREHASLLQARLAALQETGSDAAAPAPDIDPPQQPE